ncbi:MAG: polysaccharide deacetylase family protein [Vampirovibrionales bacterium]|nr:polysaccharide deacetylase family protein [Vampirovibrionales bacterium]
MLLFNFHYVEPVAARPERRHITITPQGLAWFIRTLRMLGFRFVSIGEALQAASPEALGPKSAMITFDDGYENLARHALPVLQALNCPALLFVLAGKPGGSNDWDQGHVPDSQRDRLMTFEQMRSLGESQVITFGSHGLLHRSLPSLQEDALDEELNQSYARLSAELGESFAPVFAYPWGDVSPEVLDFMAKTPYRMAFTTEKRRWTSTDSPYAIPRHSVYFRDGNPLILTAKLARHGLLMG